MALSPKALKACERNESGFDFENMEVVSMPELDPLAQYATGIVTDYNGDYEVTWDDDCEALHGMYAAWIPARDLKAVTRKERIEMRRMMKREMNR